MKINVAKTKFMIINNTELTDRAKRSEMKSILSEGRWYKVEIQTRTVLAKEVCNKKERQL